MKLVAAFGGLALAALASGANAASLDFVNGVAQLAGPSLTTTGTGITDTYDFTTAAADYISGSITTHWLSVDGTVVSDLDFTSILLDGVSLKPAASSTDANEEWSLPSQKLLGAGPHTLTVTYNVDAASTDNAASYAGVFNLATSAVPEPASWAMMIFGVGLTGGMMRRRAPKAALA
jgi:hypothetical protein